MNIAIKFLVSLFLSVSLQTSYGQTDSDQLFPGGEEFCIRATYRVPTPPTLSELAHFPTNYCIKTDEFGIPQSIKYDLPPYLAPVDQTKIELADPQYSDAGFLELVGSHGAAACSLRQTRLICFVDYPTINYDLSTHVDDLKERFDPTYVDSIFAVVETFHHDPEGVIEIWKN